MDIPTSLMMTATALLQDVESPLGHCAVFDPPQGEKPEGAQGEAQPQGTEAPDAFADEREKIAASIQTVWQRFEQREAQRGNRLDVMYDSMRKAARRNDAMMNGGSNG